MTTGRLQNNDRDPAERSELELLHEENARLQEMNREAFVYVRSKIDDLLSVLGTRTLNPEELDDHSLIEFDPIGIVTKAFQHVLDNVRETNQKLSFANNEIQAVFDTVGAAILVLDPQGNVVSYNQRTKDLLLHRDVDITGKSCREEICANRSRYDFCMFRDVTKYQRERHMQNWALNGNSFDVVGRPMFDGDGELSHVVLSYMDVSARRNAEAAVLKALNEAQDANAKLSGILRSVADSVLVTDAAGQILMLNRRAEEMFGLCLTDKNLMPDINSLPHKELVAFLKSAPKQEHDLQVRDFVFFEAGGQEHIYQARMTVIDSEKNGFNGCITILHDVTEQREVERMKSEFVSTAAHELRTPLATIIGYADLLLMKEDCSRVEQKDYLEMIQSKAERLGDIVGDLLDISRIESGEGMQLDPQPCHLDLICDEALQGFIHQSTDHEFVLEIASPTVVLADRYALTQVLENIICNAVKYSPQGGTIKVSAADDNGLCRCSVTDQGIGMNTAQLERVYEKFYRVDATNTAISGTGLGMTIVKHLIEAQGGQVRVESVPGQGSTVSFTVPYGSED